MREMVERAKGREIVLVDGVKILHPTAGRWCCPDPEEPITHVWAEAGSDHEAAAARAPSTPGASARSSGSRRGYARRTDRHRNVHAGEGRSEVFG